MYFAEKMWVAFANAKNYSHFFNNNISIYAICNDQSLNDTLTNDIISFEQLGPEVFILYQDYTIMDLSTSKCTEEFKVLLWTLKSEIC